MRFWAIGQVITLLVVWQSLFMRVRCSLVADEAGISTSKEATSGDRPAYFVVTHRRQIRVRTAPGLDTGSGLSRDTAQPAWNRSKLGLWLHAVNCRQLVSRRACASGTYFHPRKEGHCLERVVVMIVALVIRTITDAYPKVPSRNLCPHSQIQPAPGLSSLNNGLPHDLTNGEETVVAGRPTHPRPPVQLSFQ